MTHEKEILIKLRELTDVQALDEFWYHLMVIPDNQLAQYIGERLRDLHRAIESDSIEEIESIIDKNDRI